MNPAIQSPFHSTGLRYGIGPDGRRVCTGAQMGRGSVFPDDRKAAVRFPLHLRRVRLDSGGYDRGGAYWGHGLPLFCAWRSGVAVYARAADRDAAKAAVRDVLPGAKFLR